MLSRLKHSCNPNAIVQFDGRKATLLAIRTLKAGDAIQISFSLPYFACDAGGRGPALQMRFSDVVSCQCEACTPVDWSDVPEINETIKCPDCTEELGTIEELIVDGSKLTCSRCGKKCRRCLMRYFKAKKRFMKDYSRSPNASVRKDCGSWMSDSSVFDDLLSRMTDMEKFVVLPCQFEMNDLLHTISAPLFPGVDFRSAASMAGRDSWEEFKDTIKAYEVSSSLPLQTCLYFNAWFFPVWFGCSVYVLSLKLEALSELFQPLAVTVLVAATVVEMIRVYLGYSGNILEKIPELVGFWLLTLLVQFPLVTFSLFATGLKHRSVEVTLNAILMVFVSLELFFGYFSIKRIARKQVLRLRALQRSLNISAETRKTGETTFFGLLRAFLAMALLKDRPVVFEEEWPKMRPTILKLLRQDPVTKPEWHDLFYTVHSVCTWDDKGPPKVYQALTEDILQFIKQANQRVLTLQDDQALLKAYIADWRKFFEQCTYLPMPFNSLEVPSNTSTGGKASSTVGSKRNNNDDGVVRKLMLDTWNTSIFSTIKNRLQDASMKLVQAERNGEAFDSLLVIGVRESYVNLCSNTEDKLQIYRENFERAYLEATETFYKQKAQEYLQANGVENYMKYAEQKLREEEARGRKYLQDNQQSMESLMKCCVDVLVTAFRDVILAECPRMIRANETEKLGVMFRLLDRIPDNVEPMLQYLEGHIVMRGLAEMAASAATIAHDCEKYVEALLNEYWTFTDLVKTAFSDDPRFLTARDKAFKIVVNSTRVFSLDVPTKPKSQGGKGVPESKCPELLANYCDMLLRKTPLSKKLSADEVESRLRDVLVILKYVENRDVFMRFHKAHLTRRLILETSSDYEKEEHMVEWLRDVGMPAEYVSKISRMFQDIKVSEDLNQQFKDHIRASRGSLADSICVKILNAGAWSRGSERVTVSLPMELEDYIPEVEEFYKSKHSGRKLQWHHHMSNGTLIFTSDLGKYDLDVTTFQMAVLLSWNMRPDDSLSLESLRLSTQLPDTELRRTLWSLVNFPKLKQQVLQYQPDVSSAKDFTDATVFWVNKSFSLIKNGKVQKRGKVNLIGRLQLSTEKASDDDSEGMRKYFLPFLIFGHPIRITLLRIVRTQEAILKVMKTRKTLSNAQLHVEVVLLLRNMFLPSKKLIKEQIEWLIESRYIARDTTDINSYVYVV
ncbi:unnamed protein product [Notodromas monacha]|uniref:Cullin-5 n=1 Tax=Notodromas monacha TaxID=399045 RepID=A0A7R9BM86_9CRUS|nr:unnamed protein product [Notodromas monacha]CAG0916597.1 unnamed protein product [Notodromas monacha]